MSKYRIKNSILFGIITCSVALFESGGSLSAKNAFWISSSVLVLYNIFEIYYIRKSRGRYWLANPVVLSSAYLFLLLLGVTSIGFLLFENFPLPAERFVGHLDRLYKSAYPVVVLSIFSSFGMWFGYHSKVSNLIERKISSSKFLNKAIRKTFNPNWNLVYLSFFVGISLEALNLNFGFTGWHNTNLVGVRRYRQYLLLASTMQYIAPIFLAYKYSKGGSWKVLVVLVLFVSVQSLLGLTSGMKQEAIYPVVVPGMVYYIGAGKIPSRAVIASVAVLLLSVQVVTTFRLTYDRANESSNLSSVVSAYSTVVTEGSGPDEYVGRNWSLIGHLLGRMNFVSQAAGMIEYEERQRFGNNAPDFARRIFLSPAMAIVPRAVWPSKPQSTVGGWAYSSLKGIPLGPGPSNSMGITPVVYLYFAGGAVACFIGFFLLGLIQRFVFSFLNYFGFGGIIIYMSVIEPIARVSHLYYPIIVILLRFLVIGLVVQYLFIEK